MKPLGPILLSAIASIAACSEAVEMGPNSDRADDIAAEDVPQLDANYGLILNSQITLCAVGESPCPEDETLEVSGVLRGTLQMVQDATLVSGQMSGCSVILNWNGEDYDADDYLSIQDLGSLLRFDGGFVASEQGPQLQSGLAAMIFGAELSDDIGEDFPTDEDDARAFDQDKDGKPGISVKAPIGRIFMGARAVLDFEAHLNEQGELLGTLTGHDFDVSVYDDSVPFVNVDKKIHNALSPLTIIDQQHDIQLVPGALDCAAVAAQAL